MSRVIQQLSTATLKNLPKGVAVPSFAREATGSGIVHISVGGFHRSHEAVYTQRALEKYGGDWGIIGVGAFESDRSLCDALASQDCLYTLLERSGAETTASVIGSITSMIHAPNNHEAVIQAMERNSTNIISLTVTEKGYYTSPDGGLNTSHADISHDIENPSAPTTALGMIVESLARRHARGAAPLSVMSCDNVPGNGHVTSNALLSLAAARSDKLASWIEGHVAFPSSMVDRITPVATPEDRVAVTSLYGYQDDCPVVCEPYLQWVLEDSFAAGRPQWEGVGVQLTSDVTPYEHAKIRLLNMGHTALSLPAYVSGLQLVADAAQHQVFGGYLRRFMDDVGSTLPPLPGVDMEQYKDTLVERFANSAVKDQLSRIATDSSSKLSVQLVPIVEDISAMNAQGAALPLDRLAFVVAAWVFHLRGVDEMGGAMTITDPLEELLAPIAKGCGNDATPILQQEQLFGGLVSNAPFLAAVNTSMQDISTLGVAQALTALEQRLSH